MSVIKYINRKNWGKQNLKRIINYILQEEKTQSDLIHVNGISVEHAAEDILTMQKLVEKDSKRQYIHFVISFNEEVSKQTGFEVARQCAAYYEKDYPYIMSVHTDTNHIHAHVVLSTVNVHTALKFSQSKKDMLNYRDYVNQILESYDLETVGNDKYEEFESFEDFMEFDESDDIADEEQSKKFSDKSSKTLSAFKKNKANFSSREYLNRTVNYVNGFDYLDEEEIQVACESEKNSVPMELSDAELIIFYNLLLKVGTRLGFVQDGTALHNDFNAGGQNKKSLYSQYSDAEENVDIDDSTGEWEQDLGQECSENLDEESMCSQSCEDTDNFVRPIQYDEINELVRPMTYEETNEFVRPIQYENDKKEGNAGHINEENDFLDENDL